VQTSFIHATPLTLAAFETVEVILIFVAAAVGFLLFAEIPTVWTILGAAVVVASTLFITWREHAASGRAATVRS
jgi:drug/metabolite transporter (DMT)-like permease